MEGDRVGGSSRGSRILVVEDEEAHSELATAALRPLAQTIEAVDRGSAALLALQRVAFDLVVLDLCLPDMSGLDLLRWTRCLEAPPPVLFVSARGDAEHGVEAIRSGAAHYLVKREGYLTDLAVAAKELLGAPLPSSPAPPSPPLPEAGQETLLGESEGMRGVRRMIADYGPSSASVLIRGETGTGKDLVARALHEASSRARGPYVAVNCSAIPEALLENEFFGNVRGAFTGADKDRTGLIAQAEGGTLFLDEVGDLSPSLQPKLLRFLERGTYRPVGAAEESRGDVRLIAATHHDLEKRCEEGIFRLDLFFRLDVLRIDVPPLSERRGDIPLLADHFLRHFAGDAPLPAIAEQAWDELLAAPWPGNVRQLKHLIQRAVISSAGGMITCFGTRERAVAQSRNDALSLKRLVEALRRARGHVTAAAEALGVSTRTVQRHMRRHGIDSRDFRLQV